MKILLDIQDSKASFLMEILKNFSFVKKVTPVSAAKADLMQDIKDSVDELNLVRAGKIKSRNAEELLNDL